MLREYCDKCGKEIPDSDFIEHPGEDFKRWTTTRVEVKVNYGPDKDHGAVKGEAFNWTLDVLCVDCARAFKIEVD